MAATASPAAPVPIKGGVAPLRAGQGYSFWLRRLHSLSGIVPVGAFLFEHILISNASRSAVPLPTLVRFAFWPVFPLVPMLELFGIWLPILFHALYGFYIWYRGETQRWRVSLDRKLDVHGAALDRHHRVRLHALAHLDDAIYRHRLARICGGFFRQSASGTVLAGVAAFYVVGLVCASWHFAYGMWLFAAKWGLTSGRKALGKDSGVCLAFFVLLSAVGLTSLYTFRERFRSNQPTRRAQRG